MGTFYFPYLTNTNGNSRLDVLNFATLVHAFRKESLNVERNNEGKITFKLESLAKANSFESKNAHEAIADVETTMKLLEILVDKNNDLFNVFISNSYPQKLENIFEDKISLLYIIIFLTNIEYIL